MAAPDLAQGWDSFKARLYYSW